MDMDYDAIPSAEQPGMQMVYSHKVGCQQGDLALTYDSQAAQVDSRVGETHGGVSDAHDLVIAKVFGKSKPSDATKATEPTWPMPSRPPPQPEHHPQASSSAAQPPALDQPLSILPSDALLEYSDS